MPSARIANFCPHCGAPVEMRERYGRSRPTCSQCNHVVFFDPKVAVAAFIVQNDHVLMVKRKSNPGKGLWALPAGFVDYDEDPQAAASREVLEETGLTVAIDTLIDVLHRPDADGLADIVIAYGGHITGGTLQAGDDADDARWFSKDELPEIGTVTTRKLITKWAADS